MRKHVAARLEQAREQNPDLSIHRFVRRYADKTLLFHDIQQPGGRDAYRIYFQFHMDREDPDWNWVMESYFGSKEERPEDLLRARWIKLLHLQERIREHLAEVRQAQRASK